MTSLKLKKDRQEDHRVSIESYEEEKQKSAAEEPVVTTYDDSEGE